jgi:hypothetical protein
VMPQARFRKVRQVRSTLSAMPCRLTQRLSRMPIAASAPRVRRRGPPGDHTPMRSPRRSPRTLKPASVLITPSSVRRSCAGPARAAQVELSYRRPAGWSVIGEPPATADRVHRKARPPDLRAWHWCRRSRGAGLQQPTSPPRALIAATRASIAASALIADEPVAHSPCDRAKPVDFRPKTRSSRILTTG